MKYDYLIVGAGLFGSIFAYEANKIGKKVLVIDKRPHIGGNCYTEKYQDYHIHKYGPHIFHTSQKYIWDYVNQFTEFNNYSHRARAYTNNRFYSLPINLTTLHQIWPEIKTPSDAIKIINKEIIPCENPQNLEDFILSQVGPTLYELLIKGYTTKQWGRDPKLLPSSIIKRLPIRLNFSDRYYPDTDVYEGIPVHGYTPIFEKLLKDIEVSLDTDYFNNREYFDKIANKVVYSGPVDKFFDYMFGDLEYRSLEFKHKEIVNKDYQGCAVVNYPSLKESHTRVIQHKYFTFGKSDIDYVSYEYSKTYDKTNEPYYPINDESNNSIYKKYKDYSESFKNIIIGGRLGNYRYYDMDMSIGNALAALKKEFAGFNA
jgi:UDP-galactopyranose mutase